MSDSSTSDAIVIGGGVIGLACARELLAAGLAVRLLERERLGAGASHGNCGLVTPSHGLPLTRPGTVRKVLAAMRRPDAPVLVRPRLDLGFLAWGLRFARRCTEAAMLDAMHGRAALLRSGRQLLEELVTGDDLHCAWESRGLLEVFAGEKARDAAAPLHQILAENGIESRWLQPAELGAVEPALRHDLAGAQHFRCDAHLRPDRLVAELARLVRAAGGTIEQPCSVTDFLEEHGHVEGVETDRGERRARFVVLATGAWAPRLGRRLGLRLPVEAGKGYSITTDRPRPCPIHPLLLVEANMAVTPWADGIRLGGTMELAGYDTRLRPERIEALRAGARRYLRSPLSTDAEELWYGWRPMTPDELPIVDRSPRQNNVVIATGHGMMGVGMSLSTGRLVAELITGATPHVDPTPYSLARFG